MTVETIWDGKTIKWIWSRSSGKKEERPPWIPEEQKKYVVENQLLHERIKKLEQSNWDLKETKTKGSKERNSSNPKQNRVIVTWFGDYAESS